MNTVVKIRIGCFLLCGGLLFQGCSTPHFKPTYFKKGNVVQEDTFQSETQKQHVLRILAYYNEWFKEDQEGNVLIRRSLANNPDLLFNYTNKSMDSTWIATHLGMEP